MPEKQICPVCAKGDLNERDIDYIYRFRVWRIP